LKLKKRATVAAAWVSMEYSGPWSYCPLKCKPRLNLDVGRLSPSLVCYAIMFPRIEIHLETFTNRQIEFIGIRSKGHACSGQLCGQCPIGLQLANHLTILEECNK
jgi:hypothetical protein